MTELTYRRAGEYQVPNLGVPEELESLPSLTKYGMMHKQFLREQGGPKVEILRVKGQLFPHCLEVERQAEQRMATLMTALQAQNPPPDKQGDPLGWTAHMNALQAQAEEVVLTELIYVYP